MQRFFDIVFSCLAMLFLCPVFFVTIVILKLTGEGEIFYRQARVGYQGHTFTLLKFATMLKDSPFMGTGSITIANDPRVLPLGKFLRKSKINELPQLINVLSGNMSLIGPRPLTAENFKDYSSNIQNSIIKVKPGLSGIGSIVFRDEEKLINNPLVAKEVYHNEIAPYKGTLEMWYSENNNLTTYFKLIFLTILVIITSDSKVVWKLLPNLPEPTNFIGSRLKF